jgi:hypothetical protein
MVLGLGAGSVFVETMRISAADCVYQIVRESKVLYRDNLDRKIIQY